jgi:hypothetical protein
VVWSPLCLLMIVPLRTYDYGTDAGPEFDDFLAGSRPLLEEVKVPRMYLHSEINGILTSQRLYLLGRI